jgi:hypothetical protein
VVRKRDLTQLVKLPMSCGHSSSLKIELRARLPEKQRIARTEIELRLDANSIIEARFTAKIC